MKRDQSQRLYAASLQGQLVATALAQSSKVANVSVGAAHPEEKSSPKTVMNTALAGMLGLMLSAFGALAMNWWRNDKADSLH